ncbi:MAG TPA: 2'-5' RNA ligase family protein [Rhodocyclaceae bacterium]|nr:2'-5' RNA ligase family protein [Rhodocyclaceae bacterium]
MSAQLSLDGIDPPVFTDSLFYALLPDAESAGQIVDLARRLRADHRLKGAAIPSERLHVTLAFLGAFAGLPKAVVSSAIVAGERFEGAPFDVSFDRVQKFGHDKRAVVLRGSEDATAVDEFQRRLVETMRYQGLKPAGPTGFTAHLTLLYDEGGVAEEHVAPVSWTVREFVLVHSLIGQSRHEILGRWPLRPRA